MWVPGVRTGFLDVYRQDAWGRPTGRHELTGCDQRTVGQTSGFRAASDPS
jgi:hypothetical protein